MGLVDVLQADSDSKGLLGVNWRKISLQFLHIFLVTYIDGLFILFISSQFVASVQLMRRVRRIDVIPCHCVSLVQSHSLKFAHHIVGKGVSSIDLSTRDDALLVRLARGSNLAGDT